MLVKSLASVVTLAVYALAVPAPAPAHVHVLHERRDVAHPAFVKRSPVPAGRSLPVRIGLTQNNLDIGHDLLMGVSTPGSTRYGKHYTVDEVKDIFAPSAASVDAVSQWLKDAGIASFSQSVNKQWMQFDARVEVLEDLIKAKFHEYEHVDTGSTHVACDEYHVPAHIQEHVDYITPGITLMSTKTKSIGKGKGKGPSSSPLKKRNNFGFPRISDAVGPSVEVLTAAAAGDLSSCSAIMTPGCIMAMYNITPSTTNVTGNQLGIFEDTGETFAQSTLNYFFKGFAQYVPKGTKPVIAGIDGGEQLYPVTPAEAGYSETDLDLEAAIPLIYPQGVILFQTDDKNYELNYTYDGFFNNFYDAIDGSYCTFSAFGETGNSPLDPVYPDPVKGGYKHALQCGVYKPTNVISLSYGVPENALPVSYQRRQCSEIMKLGMQGISILAASGDSGVNTNRGGQCQGTNRTIFVPDFPANCPYITAVGSTYLPAGHDVTLDEEVATSSFGSGGGFSNLFPAPSYQTDAIATYFSRKAAPTYPFYNTSYVNGAKLTDQGLYNRAGRGFPDVGAVGDQFSCVDEGAVDLCGGTSLSAPVFAILLTRVNEERLLAGKSTVGFVNPALYANPKVLHDITHGNNPGCGTVGFSCAVGWDPVTGLGTPKYYEMLQLFMSMPWSRSLERKTNGGTVGMLRGGILESMMLRSSGDLYMIKGVLTLSRCSNSPQTQ